MAGNILSYLRAFRVLSGNHGVPQQTGVEIVQGRDGGTTWKLQMGKGEGAAPNFGRHPGQQIVQHGPTARSYGARNDDGSPR